MSFYYKYDYIFTNHGLQRCRERLNLKGAPDYEVKAKVMEHIKNSTHSFETENDLYLSASNSDLYFVIKKENNLIITATKISSEKQMDLMEADSDSW